MVRTQRGKSGADSERVAEMITNLRHLDRVSFSVSEFSQLAFVPACYVTEVLGYPGNLFQVGRAA